MSALP
jgi:hypothetical protein